ncbi:MAG: SRPBCC family protein [Pseudomonadota bacterium]
MDRATELTLIDELQSLKADNSAFLDEAVARNPTAHYTSEEHFRQEQTQVLRAVPVVAAHSSELVGSGAFLRRNLSGLPVLITRDENNQVHAFLNVCRHRGTRLVEEDSGCKHRFSCPYHAWTFANTGELLAAPHFDQGFPELDKAELGLKRLACEERYGFIWLTARAEDGSDLNAFLKELGPDLEALSIGELGIADEHTETRKANWKTLVEGGIESYHFRVAHRTTIGPHFENNLSSYRSFGPHLRSVLPRTSMGKLAPEARSEWRLRDHANLLYTLFPTCQLLVQQDHIVWITMEPLSAGETRLRLVTLAPRARLDEEAHWKRNHAITTMTLDEDFVIGESIQSCASSGANEAMLFGRFEGALDQFNRTVNDYIASA